MDEKLLEILNQFDIDVKNTYRSRGGTICVTTCGTMILKEFCSSAGKLMDEYELKKHLREEGFSLIDQHIKNKQGTFFAQDRYHTIYILKEFYEGKECDIRSLLDVKMAGRNLALFHKVVKRLPMSERAKKQYIPFDVLLEKRTRELKRAKAYMESLVKKGEFEYLYIKSFQEFYEQAKEGISIYENIGIESQERNVSICHGEYNQHNMIKTENGIATINFENFCYQNQLLDLHHFFRKTMEKNNYKQEFAQKILTGYSDIHPLDRQDYQFLYLLLLYPDKYYKIANHYNSRRKAFISPKDMEKLVDTIEQNKQKEQFLIWYQNQYL